MTTQKVKWTGESGKQYEYWVYDTNTTWKDAPGNYIFAGRDQQNQWVPLYIGETGSLRDRLSPIDRHEKWPCARRNGATHVHAHVNQDGIQERRKEESDLIDAHNPRCNG